MVSIFPCTSIIKNKQYDQDGFCTAVLYFYNDVAKQKKKKTLACVRKCRILALLGALPYEIKAYRTSDATLRAL
jgi:hypothetical protein